MEASFQDGRSVTRYRSMIVDVIGRLGGRASKQEIGTWDLAWEEINLIESQKVGN